MNTDLKSNKWREDSQMNKRDFNFLRMSEIDNTSNGKSVKIAIENKNSGGEVKPDLKVMCINLALLSPHAQFFTCVAGVFFFYLIYGYFQVSPLKQTSVSISFTWVNNFCSKSESEIRKCFIQHLL